jgi:hypothetical protein
MRSSFNVRIIQRSFVWRHRPDRNPAMQRSPAVLSCAISSSPFSSFGMRHWFVSIQHGPRLNRYGPLRRRPWRTPNGPSRDVSSSTATALTGAPANSTDCRRTDIARRSAGSRSSKVITVRPSSTASSLWESSAGRGPSTKAKAKRRS